MATELHIAMTAAEAAWRADDMNLDKLHSYEAAERAWNAAVAAKRAEWNALPEGDQKSSAHENADDTEGTFEDELYWLQIAVRSYDV